MAQKRKYSEEHHIDDRRNEDEFYSRGVASSSQVNGLCPDWILSNTSDTHVCKDKEWFTDYTYFPSTCAGACNDAQYVAGVGTVELPVQRSPHLSGPQSRGTLLLTNVLHVPSSLCNIVGAPFLCSPGVITRFKGDHVDSRGGVFDAHGTQVAYFDASKPLFNFKLSDPPFGPAVRPSQMQSGQNYVMSTHWPDDEMRRWNELKERINQLNSHAPEPDDGAGPYSSAEKEWLRRCYESEFKFLRIYGLSIYDEDDREQGRRIVRAMMQNEPAA